MNKQERFDRARRLAEVGDYEAALKAFHELGMEAEDSESRVDCMFGELLGLVRLNRTTEARKLLKVARKAFGDIDESHARGDLVEIQIDSVEDKWDRVLPSLERMVSRYGDMLHHPQLRDVYEEIQLRRGVRLADLGRFAEALPLLEEAASFGPPAADGILYYELGRCYEDEDRAKEAFTKALSMGLDDSHAASAHYNLGVILLKKDSCARALEELRLAAQLVDKVGTSKKHIYKAMAIAFHKLGMNEEAMRYAKLAGRVPHR